MLFVFFLIQGKDRIIFVTKEDHEAPSNAELIADDPNDPYEEQGEHRLWVSHICGKCGPVHLFTCIHYFRGLQHCFRPGAPQTDRETVLCVYYIYIYYITLMGCLMYKLVVGLD